MSARSVFSAKKNRQHKRDYDVQYRLLNREKLKAYKKQYAERFSEKIKEQKRKSKILNREKNFAKIFLKRWKTKYGYDTHSNGKGKEEARRF